jgi:hypothetical protein
MTPPGSMTQWADACVSHSYRARLPRGRRAEHAAYVPRVGSATKQGSSTTPLTCIELSLSTGGPREAVGYYTSLNLSQFVEGRRWWPWAREGREEAHVFTGDEPCTGEERHRVSARFDALQNVIN